MRPLQLAFTGIRSYPGAVGPLDFSGKTLIAILGDTGAGKSTILEAITLALYGNCTWAGREHMVLMAEGAAQMSVDFTFAHDGQRWRVHRVFHANTTPATHLLQNLDTGEEIDNKGPVNQRIEALLQLRFDSFITAVLLPQGKFDQLLTATGAVRTTLLKGIFGVQAIETVRDLAGRHRDQLTDLVHRAELARGQMLGDPSATAAAARQQAEQAKRRANHLNRALTDLRSSSKKAAAARAHHEKLTGLAASLNQHAEKDFAGDLARIVTAEADLAARDNEVALQRADCGHRREQAKAQIAAAAREGLTPESLAVAETLLKAVPSRLDELARDQAQLGTDERELSGQALQLQRSEQQLSTLQATATSRANAHTAATTTHDEYREAVDHLSACTEQALLTAATAGEAIEQEQDAVRELGVRRAAIGPLDAAVAAAAAVRQSAEDQLAAVRSHESAHAAGAALAAGDRCLICQRTLPDDYHPPAPADPQALADAERAARKAAQAEQAVGKAHAEGQAHLDAAHRTSKERQEAARQALLGFDKARTEALAAMRDAAPREPAAAAGPSVSYQVFEAALAADCSRLSAADCGERDVLRDTSARNLLEPARAIGKALAEAAAQAGQAARKAELEAARASERLASDNTAHQQASDRLVARRKRLDDSRGKLRTEIGELPALAREALPAEPLNTAPGHLTAAHAAVSGRRQHLAAMGKDRDEATGQLEELAERQRELDGRRSREIAAPLQKLAADIGLWRDAIGQAAAAIPGSTPPLLPADPASISTNDVEAYVEALAAAGAAISGRVTGAAAASDREAGGHLMKLAETASGLRAGQHGFPGIPLTDGKQLLEAGALDPVVAAEQSASDAAERHLAVHADAESQIDKAERLDTAISAGHDRLTAVDALRSLLADAKFLQYLTDRRTHALLGVASELFGQLSGGEFGFAEDFLIISRRSRATRHPKTLSGGETFLASLALALALVELHSRSGARLGALFLDEGFGSLDVDALASSLDVLRNETSGDKLVAVISHLHAVAEAVEDVMWVERRPEGSSARWLSAAERDALVRQEVTGGLLSLL